MKGTRAQDVQEFFQRVATDWDTMRLARSWGTHDSEKIVRRRLDVSVRFCHSMKEDVGLDGRVLEASTCGSRPRLPHARTHRAHTSSHCVDLCHASCCPCARHIATLGHHRPWSFLGHHLCFDKGRTLVRETLRDSARKIIRKVRPLRRDVRAWVRRA